MSASLKSNFLERLNQITIKNDQYKLVIESMVTTETTLRDQCQSIGEYFTDPESSLYLYFKSALVDISMHQEKVKNIRKILNNDEIQIVFIGGVSSGKSKVINSIIEEEIFQCSVGKTTTEIVELRASTDEKSYIKYGRKNPISFDSKDALINQIKELSTTLGKPRIEANESLEVALFHPSGSILDERIVLIDTPGYDSSDNAKDRILDISMVADIIVFVMTYIFNEEEKLMFQALSQKTSNLNIFILVNKWDDSDADIADVTEKSKISIENNILKWLEKTNESDKKACKNKYFFISAKEQLDYAINKEKYEHNKFRNEEFNRFLRELKNSIDHPEITKYKKHEKTIKKIDTELFSSIKNALQISKEIIGKRKESITLCETFIRIFKDNEEKLKERLNMEKKQRLDHLHTIIDKSNSWWEWRNYFSKMNPHDDEIFQFEELTTTFDVKLGDLEKSADESLKTLITYSITNNACDIRNITKGIQLKLPLNKPNKSVSKNQTANLQSKKKAEGVRGEVHTKIKDEKTFDSNYFEKEMVDAFQQFNETISIRLDGCINKFNIFIESITKSLNHLEEKVQILVELK